MFLKGTTGGYRRDGTQWAEGPFLVLFSQDMLVGEDFYSQELRALVRRVHYEQLGNFMMGKLRLRLPHENKDLLLSLSGPVGRDGLPLTIRRADGGWGHAPARLWPLLRPVPAGLGGRFWRSESSNTSVGEVGSDLKRWAESNIHLLRRFINVPAAITRI